MGVFGGPGGGVFGGTGTGGESAPTGTVPASKLFYAAMRKAGITLAPGRTPSIDQYTDALDEANRMIGTWNCERPRIFTIRIDQFPLDTRKTYSMGIDPAGNVTADFDAPRPQEIIRANVLFPGTPIVRRKVRILDDEEFAAITLQDIASGVPTSIYSDGAYPFCNITLIPQTNSGYSLELFSWQSIAKFAAVTDVCVLPDGFEDAIVLNLAVRLAPQFQKGEVMPSVQRAADKALAAIAKKNLPGAPKISADAPGKGRGGFNYLTGS